MAALAEGHNTLRYVSFFIAVTFPYPKGLEANR